MDQTLHPSADGTGDGIDTDADPARSRGTSAREALAGAETVTVLERSADGTFRVMARITTRATAISDDLFFIPGCVGKTECVYDDATEGVGTLINDKFFIDWLDDEGWIDDLMTIEGDEMTGDDGNGPIRLVKEE